MPARLYVAFLSYTHEDNRHRGREWANWLHEKLETYIVPPDLAGQLNDRQEQIPTSLSPIFRDQLELRATTEGVQEIQEALANSMALIVLCSPETPKRDWVQKEIALWQTTERADLIFPVLIDGTPDNAFPAGLDPQKAIGADLRPGGRPEQGFTDPKLYRRRLQSENVYSPDEIDRRVKEFNERLMVEVRRLVGGLLDIPPGRLAEREANYKARIEMQRRKRYLIVSVSMVVLAVSAVCALWYALGQANEKEQAIRDAAAKSVAAAESDAKRLKAEKEIAKKDADHQKTLSDEQTVRLNAEAGSAVIQALSIVDNYLEKSRPQDALAFLAGICRKYPDQPLAATRLFSLLCNHRWALALTPPVKPAGEDYENAGPIERIRFSPDARRLVISRYYEKGGEAEIWDISDLEPITDKIPCNTQSVGNASEDREPRPNGDLFSSDGRFFVAVAGNTPQAGGTLTIYDTETSETIVRRESTGFSAVRCLPGNKGLLTGAQTGQVIAWGFDGKSKTQFRSADQKPLPGKVVAFSENGEKALVSGKKEVLLCAVGASSKYRTQIVGPAGRILGFTPDMSIVAVEEGNMDLDQGKGRNIYVWRSHPVEGRDALEKTPFELFPYSSVPDFDGTTLVLGTTGGILPPRAVLVNLARGGVGFHNEIHGFYEDSFQNLELRRKDDLIVTIGGDQTARIWEMKDGEFNNQIIIVQAAYECSSADLSNDGRHLVVADDRFGSWRLWNIEDTRRILGKGQQLFNENPAKPFSDFELLSRDSVVVFRSGSTDVAFDLATGTSVSVPSGIEVIGEIHGPIVNKPGTRVVTPDSNKFEVTLSVTLREAGSKKTLAGQIPTVNGFARFSPDGNMLLTKSDGPFGTAIQIWDAVAGVQKGPPMTIPCSHAAFSAECDFFWTYDNFTKTLSVYDWERRRLVFGPWEIPELLWAWVEGGCVYTLVREWTYSDEVGVHPQVSYWRRKVPFKLTQATSLMCDLADAISSHKVTADGSIELVPVTKETFRGLAGRVDAEKGEDPFVQWARWLLLERDSELGNSLQR